MSNAVIPKFQLPYHVGNDMAALGVLAVVFLCPLEDDRIADVCKSICHADGALPVVPVPWTLDTIPPLSIIYKIGLQFHIFIDQDSLSSGTAIVAKDSTDHGAQFARVPLEAANAIASSCQDRLSTTSLSALVDQGALFSIRKEEAAVQPDDPNYEAVVPPPDHLPTGIHLEPSTITFIALAHIPGEDLKSLKSRIGTSESVTDIVIHNWPEAREPATRADLYRLFQAVGPVAHDDVDESFLFFIEPDADSIPGYRILQASMRWSGEHGDGGIFGRNSVSIASVKDMKQTLILWNMFWDPFTTSVRRGPTVDGSRVNHRLDTLMYSEERGNTYGNYFDIIPNPDRPLVLPYRGPPIFLLSDMKESDMRLVRDYVSARSLQDSVLCNVCHLVPSPDVEGLVALFESPGFLATGQEPPTECFAVDQTTLEIAKGIGEASAEDSVIVLSRDPMTLEVWDDNSERYSKQSMGYAYGRLDVDEADSAWANLETANMDFWELVPEYEWVSWAATRAWMERNQIMDDKEIDEPFALIGAFYPGVDEIVKG